MTKKTEKEEIIAIGRGGGLAVSRIDFNSDDLSSNPIFSLKMLFEKPTLSSNKDSNPVISNYI